MYFFPQISKKLAILHNQRIDQRVCRYNFKISSPGSTDPYADFRIGISAIGSFRGRERLLFVSKSSFLPGPWQEKKTQRQHETVSRLLYKKYINRTDIRTRFRLSNQRRRGKKTRNKKEVFIRSNWSSSTKVAK